MAEDLIELGLEGFDRLTDRYYDVVHETACKVGPWIKDQRSRGRKDSKGAKGQSMPTSPVEDRPSRGDRYDRDLDDGQRRKSDGRDYDDRRDSGRRRNVDHDDDYDYRGGARSRTGSFRDREQYSRSPQIHIDDAPPHIYPPGPGAMAPPYPTTAGALVAMPPDANYPPPSRSRSTRELDVPHNSRHERARSAGQSDDYYDNRRRRSSGGNSEGRARSRSRVRHYSSYRKEEKKERDMHIGAGLIGAMAGGYAARMAGKGDWKVTAAGAVVGALGGGLLEKGFDKHKKKDSRQEDAWEQKWGRR